MTKEKTDVLTSHNSTTTSYHTTNPPKIIDEHFICALFNLNPTDILHFQCLRDTANGNTSIHLTLNPTSPPCPRCGEPSPLIKDYYTRKINHSVLSDSHTILYLRDRRYICRHCRKTYYAQNPLTETFFRHSLLTTQLVLQDLKNPNMTMTSVAQRYHLSPTTIANIFDAHVDIGRKPLPKFLCIDEVYAFRSQKSKYVCVLLDYKNKTPIDILPSRIYEDLARFFSAIPKEEREKVSVFSTDMWEAYRSIAKRYLPNACIIVDHFHIIQECHKRLDRVRLNIQKTFPKKSQEYYLLKKFNWVLFKNDNTLFDENREKKYNKKMKRYLNYHDIKCLLQDSHPQLEMAINLKDALCMYYDSIKIVEADDDANYQEDVPKLKYKADGKATKRSYKRHIDASKRNSRRALSHEEAKKELEQLIMRFRECPLIEFSSFATTMNNWKEEIVNSLQIYVELDRKRVSNSLIENRNKIIKNVKRTANGYGNWRRFKNRLMYTLDPNSTYSIIADESVINHKRKMNKQHYLEWRKRHDKTRL